MVRTATRKKLQVQPATRQRVKNCENRLRGQNHPKADLLDTEVDLIRQLHEEGWGYKRLSAKFDKPRATIKSICRYRTR